MTCPKDADTGPKNIGQGCLSKYNYHHCTRKKHKYGMHHCHYGHRMCKHVWTTEEAVLEAL